MFEPAWSSRGSISKQPMRLDARSRELERYAAGQFLAVQPAALGGLPRSTARRGSRVICDCLKELDKDEAAREFERTSTGT
jgi:hypothetical protein